MKKNTEKNLRICGSCHKELPIEAFYVNKRTHHADNYCKECRKAMTSNQYRNCIFTDSPLNYPVITQTADPELRMSLILKALQTVNESIARKQLRVQEELRKKNEALLNQAG